MTGPGRKPDVTDDELLSALASVTDPSASPVATPEDVAAEVQIQRDGVRKRLNPLAESGPVKMRKVGRQTVYWLPPEDDRQTRLPEHDDSDEEQPRTVEGADGETVPVDQLVADLWTWLEGRPPQKSHGRAALADVFRALLEAGGEPVETADLKAVVYAGDRREKWSNERAAWQSVSRYLGDVPGVEGAGGEWWVDHEEAGRSLTRGNE